jgi:two-component system chemotaxis sensor kinase CheA
MIMDLNPFKQKKITIRRNELVTKEIIVNADFIRVMDKDTVEFIMIIFEDITGIINYEKQIQEQKTRYQQEVESVTAILKSGPALFSNFIDESAVILNDISSKKNSLASPKVLNHVFRQAHSLKGAAKHLELNHISGLAHRIEDMLAAMRDNPGGRPEVQLEQMDELIVELFREFRELSKMIERLREFSGVRTGIDRGEPSTPLREFLDSLPAMALSIAAELKKDVRLEIENSLDDIPFLPLIRNPIIHMIRNSIDHGIEDQFERLSRNKNAAGKIHVRLSDDGSFFHIEVEDDGGGIDFDRIRMKAIEKNMAGSDPSSLTRSSLLRMVFTPGFSSRDTVTELSGRGYGLDIVKDAADRLNGKVIVNTRRDKGTSIMISIPHQG